MVSHRLVDSDMVFSTSFFIPAFSKFKMENLRVGL
jgi:hypothetical protein